MLSQAPALSLITPPHTCRCSPALVSEITSWFTCSPGGKMYWSHVSLQCNLQVYLWGRLLCINVNHNCKHMLHTTEYAWAALNARPVILSCHHSLKYVHIGCLSLFLTIFCCCRCFCCRSLFQTAAMTGTLPHSGHKTLRKWERCHPTADITPHWIPVIHQTFTHHHAGRRLGVGETGTGTGTGPGQIRWTTKPDSLTLTFTTPGITITVTVTPDSRLQTTVTVAVATRRSEAARSKSLSLKAASRSS